MRQRPRGEYRFGDVGSWNERPPHSEARGVLNGLLLVGFGLLLAGVVTFLHVVPGYVLILLDKLF